MHVLSFFSMISMMITKFEELPGLLSGLLFWFSFLFFQLHSYFKIVNTFPQAQTLISNNLKVILKSCIAYHENCLVILRNYSQQL